MLQKSSQRPTAAALAALVVVRHVAAASLDSPGSATAPPDATVPPNLDHWLALALECTVEGVNAPSSLKLWLERARGDRDESVLNQVDGFEQTLRQLHAGGMDAALDWIVDEFKPLIAWSDDDELTILSQPPPLLRSSPLGLFVRRNYLTLSRMELDEMQAWWRDFDRFVEGEKKGKRRAVDEGGEASAAAAAAFAYSKARAQQDYHSAREIVRTFPVLSSDPSANRSSQEALLHLALLEYEDGGFVAARQALDEATRIARTVSDVRCLAACRSLERRLDSGRQWRGQSDGSSAEHGPVANSDSASPHDLLWDLERRREAGTDPLQSLFHPLYVAHGRYRSSLFPAAPSPPKVGDSDHNKDEAAKAAKGERPDPEWDAKWHAAAAGIWNTIGIESLARVHEELALEFGDPVRPTWDIRLSILARRTRRLAAHNRHDDALALLLTAVATREKRTDLGRREVRVWRDLVYELEADRAARRGDTAGASRIVNCLSHDPAVLRARTPFSVDVDDETQTVYALLTKSATAHHLSRSKLDEPSRLASLIALVQLRVTAAAAGGPARLEAERGLAELEEAWPALLALDTHPRGGGGGAGVAETDEGELMTRAREAKAKLEISASLAQDDLLPPIIEALDAVAQSYERLSLPLLAARDYSLLASLCDHLAAGFEPALDPAAEWLAQADEYERRSGALMDEVGRHGRVGREMPETISRSEAVSQVVDLVVEAVETSVR